MNSKIIIIAILILVKVVGVASRARAESLGPRDYNEFGLFGNSSLILSSCYSAKQVNYIIKKENYYNPVYRCGQSKYNLNII